MWRRQTSQGKAHYSLQARRQETGKCDWGRSPLVFCDHIWFRMGISIHHEFRNQWIDADWYLHLKTTLDEFCKLKSSTYWIWYVQWAAGCRFLCISKARQCFPWYVSSEEMISRLAGPQPQLVVLPCPALPHWQPHLVMPIQRNNRFMIWQGALCCMAANRVSPGTLWLPKSGP